MSIELITVKEASKRLGISESTFRAWLCRSRFAYVKIGRRTLINVEDIEAYVQSHRRPALSLATLRKRDRRRRRKEREGGRPANA